MALWIEHFKEQAQRKASEKEAWGGRFPLLASMSLQ
jgi:hypothetical protein